MELFSQTWLDWEKKKRWIRSTRRRFAVSIGTKRLRHLLYYIHVYSRQAKRYPSSLEVGRIAERCEGLSSTLEVQPHGAFLSPCWSAEPCFTPLSWPFGQRAVTKGNRSAYAKMDGKGRWCRARDDQLLSLAGGTWASQRNGKS